MTIKIKEQEVLCKPAQQHHYDIGCDSFVTLHCFSFIHKLLSLLFFFSFFFLIKKKKGGEAFIGISIYCKKSVCVLM